jgi:D-glycero-D-manno-heptose 1,7-bisphosphate phosphatase
VVVTISGARVVGGKPTGRTAVFFDRDGVLAIPEIRDGRSFAVRRLEDFAVYPDAEETVRRVREMGAIAVVVTNQPDVGNGLVGKAIVEEMHQRLRRMVPVDAVYACYHTRADGCACRKPKPGMLLAASRDLGIDLSRSVIVGDRATDVAAGHEAGCRAILIERGDFRDEDSAGADWVAANLTEALDHICAYFAAASGDDIHLDGTGADA